jgi:Sigma-70, region 4
MVSLDNLPADQRAVLELVLTRGRTYDEIAQMLSIDRAGVRERALAAFDALGPQTRVPPERRALITDYVLGQLPPKVTEDTRQRLAQSAGERAWARVLASELAPLATQPLPEIPSEGAAEPEPVAAESGSASDLSAHPFEPVAEPVAASEGGSTSAAARALNARPSSRRGGIILLSIGALVVVAAIVVIALVSNGSSHKSSSTTASQPSSTSTPSTSSTPSTASTPSSTTTTAANGAKLVAQINLKAPHTTSKAIGVALVLKQGTNTGIAIRAQNLPANGKHDAYAVWLYKSSNDSHILGFVNPSVGANGVLQAEAALPANAGHFTQVLVTRETQQRPSTPGAIVLQGALKGLS